MVSSKPKSNSPVGAKAATNNRTILGRSQGVRIGFTKCLSVFVLMVASMVTCQSATGAEKLSGSMGWDSHVVNLLVHPFNGLLGFIFIVFVSSLACGFLLLAIHRLLNRNSDPSVRSLFARKAFIKLRWPL